MIDPDSNEARLAIHRESCRVVHPDVSQAQRDADDALRADAMRWRKLWAAVEEGTAEVVIMGRLNTIHTGLTVTDGADLTDEVDQLPDTP